MNPEPAPVRDRTRERIFLAWAVAATLLAFMATGTALFIYARTRNVTSVTVASPFAALKESDVPGRYKWTEPGNDNVFTLSADHTFIGKDGRKYPMHQWEILRDGIMMVFMRNTVRLNRMEAPGIYTGVKSDGTAVRMEKVE